MISRLSGIILQKTSTEVIIDCCGVGYQASISVNTSGKLPEPGVKVSLFTLLIPREDALLLFGFHDEAEREVFKMLTSVSGVGPKIALGILSSLSVDELQEFIIGGNLPALQKLPGIGKKTAERVILELRDKIAKLGIADKQLSSTGNHLIRQEAMAALITLGYSSVIAEKAVKKALSDHSDKEVSAESLIKLALKYAMI